MKKILLTFSLLVAMLFSSFAQQVFFSGFENWVSEKPTDWAGAGTNATVTNYSQLTTGTFEGSSAIKFANTTTNHKRFSTQVVAVEQGQAYSISYYAKGNGDIRSAIYKGATGRYTAYSEYSIVNYTEWTKITQTVVSDTNSATSEFVLSFRNTSGDGLMVDSFEVKKTVVTVEDASIYNIQFTTNPSGDSPYKDKTVSIGGIVSAVKSGTSSAYWIQNGSGPWSGIYVFDKVNKPSIGDSVKFEALVTEYNKLSELKNVTNFTKVSGGHNVAISDVSLAEANEEKYEGVLCKVTNVKCESGLDTYKEWKIGDGIDNLTVGDFFYEFAAPGPSIGTYYNIVGVMDYSFNTIKIQPRSASDVTVNNSINEETPIWTIYPNPADVFINIALNAEGTIRISDLQGKTVYSDNFNKSITINTADFAAGFYNISIIKHNGTTLNSKFVVK